MVACRSSIARRISSSCSRASACRRAPRAVGAARLLLPPCLGSRTARAPRCLSASSARQVAQKRVASLRGRSPPLIRSSAHCNPRLLLALPLPCAAPLCAQGMWLSPRWRTRSRAARTSTSRWCTPSPPRTTAWRSSAQRSRRSSSSRRRRGCRPTTWPRCARTRRSSRWARAVPRRAAPSASARASLFPARGAGAAAARRRLCCHGCALLLLLLLG